MPLTLVPADLADTAFVAIVAAHTDLCDRTAPPESCHRLTPEGLSQPGLSVWAVWEEGSMLGMGALKELSAEAGEIKSMHVMTAARGRGIGRHILSHLMSKAGQEGMTSLWLETGVHPLFAPARALYAAFGFKACAPFGHYRPDPHSVFMTRSIAQKESPA